MLTPWKGIHNVLFFEKLYRKELISLGITELAIFGDDIYKTDNQQADYKKELVSFSSKDSLVKFHGKVAANEIYSKTDILIHSSIEPEPFGRVILEAFSCGIPVLSHGLGGSSELFRESSELLFNPYDYEDLFQKIKMLIENDTKRNEIQTKLIQSHFRINEQAKTMLDNIFGKNDD
jgi:glycosyltransferase involved in cell wall biosynthesis